MPVALHHVQLTVPRDEEDAARGGVWFRAGPVLHLGVEDDFRPARRAHPGVLVDDLDDVVRRLRGAGQNVTRDGDFPGYRWIYARGPFGNRLE